MNIESVLMLERNSHIRGVRNALMMQAKAEGWASVPFSVANAKFDTAARAQVAQDALLRGWAHSMLYSAQQLMTR